MRFQAVLHLAALMANAGRSGMFVRFEFVINHHTFAIPYPGGVKLVFGVCPKWCCPRDVPVSPCCVGEWAIVMAGIMVGVIMAGVMGVIMTATMAVGARIWPRTAKPKRKKG